ncbi:uncharacterized protein Dana_GF16961 [Drosophila ananassae]|uniref:Uncharacterized protein n=1 Tax=Drosophila ananassae TaxID=7217 RepID=B3LVI1_DROAN|nr:uncharacterized protein LOC6499752 [Drosophila ananassae]EDV42551.1 uncharacterized protein Dana_GF16961 [Drosophila ananassae]
MSISCQQIRLSHLVGPVAPRVDPPRSVVNGARRNLFGTTPEECNIDGVLARLQRRELQRVKATYNYDILDMERREQEEAEVKGVRFPYADSSSSAPDQSHHKVHRPTMGAGVSISSQQISASIRKISQKDSSDPADKRHGQKPYAVPQPQGLKRSYRVCKATKPITSSGASKKSHSPSDVINNNNVDTRPSELDKKESVLVQVEVQVQEQKEQ